MNYYNINDMHNDNMIYERTLETSSTSALTFNANKATLINDELKNERKNGNLIY